MTTAGSGRQGGSSSDGCRTTTGTTTADSANFDLRATRKRSADSDDGRQQYGQSSHNRAAIHQQQQEATTYHQHNTISQQQHNAPHTTAILRSEESLHKGHRNSRSEAGAIDCPGDEGDDDGQVEDEESLSEALLAIASAEEYAAKITKLQQACLTPLKEDLADWLNKILKSSSITTENFMDKLDNGVIICRLAKIISHWCEQQLTKETTSSNHIGLSFHSNQFLNNLTRMHQSKIWEDAKGRTFYARDNVCNFIDWSKEFGVNQSVSFESDDLVLHDATDELILRYCKHKEEEAARKKIEELALATAAADKMLEEELAKQQPKIDTITDHQVMEADSLMPDESVTDRDEIVNKLSLNNNLTTHHETNSASCPVDSLDSGEGPTDSASTGLSRTHADSQSSHARCDNDNELQHPTPSKRTSLSPIIVSQQTSSTPESELSSSRSSLSSSNHDETNQSSGFGRQITSDLDGKVMRIAKSYYGKGATKDVTRLSEGKYKIADRIVFVRLLKGHRVMVRIGGGWDTLENFLFRHKSDPSQVIDVDNLLPLGAKMSFEKSPQITSAPTSTKLPHYRRSNSASSTNLSISNLSISNHSISSTNAPSSQKGNRILKDRHRISNSVESSPARHNQQRIPYLLIHNGLKSQSRIATPIQNNSALYTKNGHRITNAHSGSTSLLRRPQAHYQFQQQEQLGAKLSTINHVQRPLSASRASAASASNLYPATLTTRITPSSLRSAVEKPTNSTNHLGGNKINKMNSYKSENLRNISGRSSESLQTAAYNRLPVNRRPKLNGSSQQLGEFFE